MEQLEQLELFPTALKDNIGDIDIIFESGVIAVTNLSRYLDDDDIAFIIEKVNGKVKITNGTLSFSASDEMFSNVYEWKAIVDCLEFEGYTLENGYINK